MLYRRVNKYVLYTATEDASNKTNLNSPNFINRSRSTSQKKIMTDYKLVVVGGGGVGKSGRYSFSQDGMRYMYEGSLLIEMN